MVKRGVWLIQFVLIIALLGTFASCSSKEKKALRLQKFDSETWIEDKSGCNGDRLSMKDELLSVKYNMRGLKTDEIEDLLGKPDAQELYNRSQRYYIYFLDPGPKCGEAVEEPQALFVRFSAVGIANEFTIKPL